MRRFALKLAPALLVPLAAAWTAGARGIALAPLVAALTVVVVGAGAALVARRPVLRQSVLAWLLGLVAWGALAAALRPVALAPAAWVVATGATALGLAVIATSPRGAAWAATAVVTAGSMCAVWLLVEAAAVGARPAGPLGNPNLAAAVALLALLTLPRVRSRPVGKATLAMVLLGGVLASGSRGAMLALLAGCVVSALRATGRRHRRLAAAAAAAAVVVFVLVLARQRAPLRQERTRLWEVAMRTAAAELPLGSGPGGYADAALPHNFPRSDGFARFHRVPGVAESDLFQLAATLGLPGLCLAAGLAWCVGRGAWRAGASAAAVAAAVAAGSLVNTQMAAPVVAWTTVLALAASRPRRAGVVPRFTRSPARALVLAAIVAAPAGLALTWPAPGLGLDAERLCVDADARARGANGDDRIFADAAAQAWLAAQVRPRWGRAWRLVGSIALERAERRREAAVAEQAANAFHHARELNRNDVWAALGEGQAHRLRGDLPAAAAAFQAAVAVEPNCVPCWLELATLGAERGDLGQARAALEHAEAASRSARQITFVSAYEQRLAAADPLLLARLRASLGGGR